jgi:hypothetical protein
MRWPRRYRKVRSGICTLLPTATQTAHTDAEPRPASRPEHFNYSKI